MAQRNRGFTVTAISEADFVDITELRVLLEPHALERSAPNLTEGDLKQALSALKRSSKTKDLMERASLHWDFHRILYSKCGRPRLIAQVAHLHLGINRYMMPMWTRHGLSEDWDESHEGIVEAIRTGRIDAAKRIVVDQIVDAQHRVLGAIVRARRLKEHVRDTDDRLQGHKGAHLRLLRHAH